MGIVLIDGQEVEVGNHERLNGIQAARKAGVEVPHYCWHAGLTVVASCRMCLVETGTRNAETGEIKMLPKLVPACQTPAKEGTVFVTNSEKVRQSRAFVEECLLIDHPIDCSICDKAGECSLQDYHFDYGQKERRADIQPFHSRRRSMGETVTLFVDRCVMCTRCTRCTREIAGTAELMVINRGASEEIDVFPGFPLSNKLSGNVVDLCPVGALGDKDFLYQQRVWFMKSNNGVCAGCSTGCSIKIEENQNEVYRLKPRENMHINQWWMCDEGRYGYHHANSLERISGPWKNSPDGPIALDWTRLPDELSAQLKLARPLAAVLSPFLTVEDAFRLATVIRNIDPQAVVALGPVPVVGENETFKNGFTIRAEKCPNRKGVAEVVKHFDGLTDFAELLNQVDAGNIQGVWFSGGSPDAAWVDADTASRLGSLKLLIVQDLFPSPLTAAAHYILPATSFAEREGSYVNYADRLQSFRWAVRPRPGVRSEGSIFQQMLGIKGLYRAAPVLEEVVRVIPYFAGAQLPVPEQGADLRANQLAAT